MSLISRDKMMFFSEEYENALLLPIKEVRKSEEKIRPALGIKLTSKQN